MQECAFQLQVNTLNTFCNMSLLNKIYFSFALALLWNFSWKPLLLARLCLTFKLSWLLKTSQIGPMLNTFVYYYVDGKNIMKQFVKIKKYIVTICLLFVTELIQFETHTFCNCMWCWRLPVSITCSYRKHVKVKDGLTDAFFTQNYLITIYRRLMNMYHNHNKF